MSEIVTINDATLYHGDCREILPSLVMDVVVTDPPYGVALGRKTGQQAYASFEDTPQNIRDIVVPVITDLIGMAKRVAVTPGNRNAWYYPKPDDIGVWYNPAGSGCGPWGFVLAHLILYYGKDPHARLPGWMAPSVEGLQSDVTDIKNRAHPCPKPEKFMNWLVGKATLPGETVLDPFMGSGTTGMSCASLGRKFIGVEIERQYFDLACERVEQSYSQLRLFG